MVVVDMGTFEVRQFGNMFGNMAPVHSALLGGGKRQQGWGSHAYVTTDPYWSN